jgi:hypothetical protein
VLVKGYTGGGPNTRLTLFPRAGSVVLTYHQLHKPGHGPVDLLVSPTQV